LEPAVLNDQSSGLRTPHKKESTANTVDTIVEAAILAIEESGGLDTISSRKLAQKSGFSVGSVYRYFKDKDHLFSKVWLFFITRLHGSLVPKINSFPATGTLRQLMMVIVDHYFNDLSRRKPSRGIPLYRMFIKASVDPENMAKPIDVLIEPLMNAQKINKTDTMKIMDENEVRIYLRGALAMVRSDFLEGNPYFGTLSHQRVVLEALVRLFQK
jgi:AcrR family transcriptional regulator